MAATADPRSSESSPWSRWPPTWSTPPGRCSPRPPRSPSACTGPSPRPPAGLLPGWPPGGCSAAAPTAACSTCCSAGVFLTLAGALPDLSAPQPLTARLRLRAGGHQGRHHLHPRPGDGHGGRRPGRVPVAAPGRGGRRKLSPWSRSSLARSGGGWPSPAPWRWAGCSRRRPLARPWPVRRPGPRCRPRPRAACCSRGRSTRLSPSGCWPWRSPTSRPGGAWSRAGVEWPARRTAYFLSGVGAIAIALLSPIEAYDTVLFSVHVTQHMLLTMVAAPLLALGAPITPGPAGGQGQDPPPHDPGAAQPAPAGWSATRWSPGSCSPCRCTRSTSRRCST